MDPSSWFGGIGPLSYSLSVVFFAWFVGVFIMLSARSLPNKGNLGSDLVFIASDASKRLRSAFSLPELPTSNNNENLINYRNNLNTSIKGHTQRPMFRRGHYAGNGISEMEEMARKCRVEICKMTHRAQAGHQEARFLKLIFCVAYTVIDYVSNQMIQTGMIEIDLFYPKDMHHQECMLY